MTPLNRSHGRRTSSTSAPTDVSAPATASGGRSVGQTSRSQETTTFIAISPWTPSPGARELLEEPDVALEEQPAVGHAVAKHRDAFDTQPEREAGEPLRVVADVLEHLRMDQAAAEELDPPGGLARTATRSAAQEAGHRELRAGL